MDLCSDHAMGICVYFDPFNCLEPFSKEVVRIASVWRKLCPLGLAAS